MEGKIKSITNPRLSLDILSPEDVQRIHTATLDIIESLDHKLTEELERIIEAVEIENNCS